jgi:putative lipoic acid-binding regulatory protein
MVEGRMKKFTGEVSLTGQPFFFRSSMTFRELAIDSNSLISFENHILTTSFTYKVMGLAKPELVDQVVEVVQRHAPGDYSPSVKPSSKGNYHSVSITITATHIEQVETLYEELGNIEIVRMVL